MVEWLEKHQIPCIYKYLLGIDCPTCGFQRAFLLLLKGDVWKSIQTYPALIPTIILLLALISWMIFKKPGWFAIRRFIQVDLVIIFVSYFLKIIYSGV
jgi:hypothetical protein